MCLFVCCVSVCRHPRVHVHAHAPRQSSRLWDATHASQVVRVPCVPDALPGLPRDAPSIHAVTMLGTKKGRDDAIFFFFPSFFSSGHQQHING